MHDPMLQTVNFCTDFFGAVYFDIVQSMVKNKFNHKKTVIVLEMLILLVLETVSTSFSTLPINLISQIENETHLSQNWVTFL